MENVDYLCPIPQDEIDINQNFGAISGLLIKYLYLKGIDE